MAQIQLRRDVTANWQTANPLLAQGEVGVDLTNRQIKIGDGATAWNNLNYYAGSYNDVTNKPTINGVTVTGALTTADLGLQATLTAGTGITIQDGVISATAVTPSNMVTTDTEQTITAAKTFNTSVTIADDILTAEGYRIANGGLGADMLSLGDSNASMALYSNGEIQVTTSSSGANTLLHSGNIGSYAATTIQGIKLWKGTQTEYEGIATKDENTLYIITGA